MESAVVIIVIVVVVVAIARVGMAFRFYRRTIHVRPSAFAVAGVSRACGKVATTASAIVVGRFVVSIVIGIIPSVISMVIVAPAVEILPSAAAGSALS